MGDPIREQRKLIEAARRLIEREATLKPYIAVILGTGLGGLVNEMEVANTIPYQRIPGFPTSTVESHAGELVCGRIGGVPITVLRGRWHLYEGYSPIQIALPMRVVRALGAEVLIVTNAAGGLNPLFHRGDVMAIVDHINLTGANPLSGPNDEQLGPRFPSMYHCYDPDLVEASEQVALELGIPLPKGVYVGVLGPTIETAAEYRFLRNIGGDAVGMSTVIEVIAARHVSLRVAGFSVITDMGLPDAMEEVSHEMVVAAAEEAEPKLVALVSRLISRSTQRRQSSQR